VPNVLISVFLTNLSHLGLVWDDFQQQLYDNPNVWAVVQGILAPAITTLFYYFLPAIFRRLVTNAGDTTRTGRERHVMHKLFSFFVINNLIIFSLFSTAWAFVTIIVNSSNGGENAWDNLVENQFLSRAMSNLILTTPYWCSWLLQRNLGAAIDLSQVVRLTWGSISRRFLSPTPRELIELTAPQPFEYAGYYNYFLFYSAVALALGPLQPLALAITGLYFWMDSFSKKYMLLYIFITKYESGGMFWRSLFNRVLICAILGNVVTALLVVSKGDSYIMLGCLAPLIFAFVGFKWYCMKTFDDPIHYYTHGKQLRDEEAHAGNEGKRRKGERVGTRFGHPALFRPLITPMVSAKSQHMLKQIYSGRTSLDETGRQAGYSDVYLDAMDANQPGKSSGGAAPFEIVHEHEMDYEHWKNKPEFKSELGGEGELYGQSRDMMRPGTPSSMMTGPTRTGTWESSRSRSQSADPYRHTRASSRDSDTTRVGGEGTDYPQGYHRTPTTDTFSRPTTRHQESREGLVTHAARMAQSPPPKLPTPDAATPGGYGPIRYNTPGATPYEDDPSSSYDYFRRGR
jgi:calcium permeable stress-gated cation channel